MHPPHATEPLPRVWERLATRVAQSAERGRQLITVLREDMPERPLAAGGRVRAVYAATGAGRRSGEAERLRLVDLAAAVACRLPLLPAVGCECLVLAGDAVVDDEALGTLDHHRRPAGPPELRLASAAGARLLVRESRPPPQAAGPATQRAAESTWERFPGGVGRRRLGRVGSEHTFLLRMAPGSRLPMHRHAHDEECLMLEGELFVEDRLLRAGDFQVVPAGGLHTSVTTEGGALVYIHGDAEPDLVRRGTR